ncbi:fatty acid alpha-hydroxylase [Lunasporangiospora selenospora]|uniref:Ceramide very long chain fatty acid hydroxylase n=1 Tax=Lunasporangiospora selenospora TaxID=979761 RepID=A0A9P6KEG5_9FUNG|nr:fatty acid alpha-hydroxylase [Lunasporangiospora selenospora]
MAVYSNAEVQKHASEDSCWVIYSNNVYDMTSFVQDHPGGEDYILDHAGQDVTDIMKDEASHSHSEGAYEMMEDFLLGSLAADSASTATTSATAASVSGLSKRVVKGHEEDDEEDEDAQYFKPTDLAADKKTKFLDLNQPLLFQLWSGKFSKAFYLEQVHIPRHLSGSARIFGSPFLELFTKTPWYMIPILWLPVITYGFHLSTLPGRLETDQATTLFVVGIALWSFAEYVIHRFLFHLDDLMPDTNVSIIAHFLLHGIHHYLPMDRLRLVMPPALSITLALPINMFVHSLLPLAQAHAVMAGLLFGYVLYDVTHYYLHHARPFKIHFKEMKTYHLAHHYKNYEGGYGITSKIWDKVFNTELQL